ncbi:Transcriptional regulator, MarR family [Cystobacter fuscus DSM 2262]|uniref:Transcriptional regulator, MarR family n=1 Tax=Cystobacter fuscus (strain ATCC 25194 / DSM 2262 / NBRC 100088 / M29) TaxID=1242864 RepID=S9PNH8_CYSF2|nr:MarR family transcriptional regulator [Cystobacter fuscus]EPX64556.1 Transcriptional regulator, MarR family [Cystobacter fuscus DSM 2262]
MDIDYDTGYFVTRTARAFMRVAEAQLRPLGLGVAHIPVLVCLAEEGALTQTEIAQRTHVEQPTAAALLQRMDRAGLIERSPDPRDRRATRIRLSARAEKLLPRALELLGQSNDEATAGLSSKEIETLHGLLRRALANLAAMTDEQS